MLGAYSRSASVQAEKCCGKMQPLRRLLCSSSGKGCPRKSTNRHLRGVELKGWRERSCKLHLSLESGSKEGYPSFERPPSEP